MNCNRVDAKKLTPAPQEIKLLWFGKRENLPAVPENNRREQIAAARKKRNRATGRLIGIAAVSLLLNMVQAFIIYVLRVGLI